MSLISLSTGSPTVDVTSLQHSAQKAGFTIPPDSQDETDYLAMQNAFDAVATTTSNLPTYTDPRLTPLETTSPRTWTRATPSDPTTNPLNAWSHLCTPPLQATHPTSQVLSGKTIAIKANISISGAPLDIGTSPSLFTGGKYALSTIAAPIVRRVLEAGATVLGTATCENLSLYAISLTADTGAVHNAWKHGYVTGGSSSGCAALISAKDVRALHHRGGKFPSHEGNGDVPCLRVEEGAYADVDMGIGGDQGGSIRIPAHFSGIYGLKPTFGLVPYTGVASLLPMIDHVGPMGRSVEDVAVLLGVLAGADGIDARQSPETPLRKAVPDYAGLLETWRKEKEMSGEWTPDSAAKGLRIGILKEGWEVAGLNPDVSTLVRESANRFKDLGAQVKEISVPMHLLAPAIWTVAGRAMIPHSLGNRASGLLGHTLPDLDPIPIDQEFYDYMAHRNPSVVNVLLNAQHLETKFGPGLTRKAHELAAQLIAEYDKAFEEVDVLIAPVTGKVAMKHPEGVDQGKLGAMEMAMTQIGATLNTCPFNLSGHPAMSIPCGWSMVEEGTGKLPVGMQIIGKRWHELDILKAAMAWEVRGKGMDSL